MKKSKYYKIMILGPPCVGKTTLAYTALKNKIPSFTTHGLQGRNKFSSMAKTVINLDMSLFFDAGGLGIGQLDEYKKIYGVDNPNIIGNEGFNIKIVLLLPSEEVYSQRKKDEIAENPEREKYILKWTHTYYQFKEQKSFFDLVVEDDISPQETVDLIIETFGLEK